MSISDDVHSEILIHSALRGNSYDVYLPWFKSIGFRTQSLKYSHVDSENPSLAQEFLVNSRCTRNDPESENSVEMYLADSGITMLSLMGEEELDKNEMIPLPEGPPLELELGNALIQRRSIRKYTGDALGIDYLSTLMRAGAGVTAEATVPLQSGGEVKMHYRTAPSAGGLYPIDIYVGAVNIKGLEIGIYKFLSKQDCLKKFLPNADSIDLLMKTCAFPEEILSYSRSNAIILLVAKPWKTIRKYGNRGLKFVYQEAGAISQNIHLAAAALGLGSVDCAGFYDHDIHKLLTIDGVNQALIHVIVTGIPG